MSAISLRLSESLHKQVRELAKREGIYATPEEAVIGHGELEGPFVEIDGLKIKRDTRFPVRVTVQFYKATSNGVVSQADMAEIARQITAALEATLSPEEQADIARRPTEDVEAYEAFLRGTTIRTQPRYDAEEWRRAARFFRQAVDLDPGFLVAWTELVGIYVELYDKGDGTGETLDLAERALARAQALTQQLLTFSKGGAPVKKSVSMEAILRDTVEFVLRGSQIPHLLRDLRYVVVDELHAHPAVGNFQDQLDPGPSRPRVPYLVREEFLGDFAKRMLRCQSPASAAIKP